MWAEKFVNTCISNIFFGIQVVNLVLSSFPSFTFLYVIEVGVNNTQVNSHSNNVLPLAKLFHLHSCQVCPECLEWQDPNDGIPSFNLAGDSSNNGGTGETPTASELPACDNETRCHRPTSCDQFEVIYRIRNGSACRGRSHEELCYTSYSQSFDSNMIFICRNFS